MEKIEKGAGAEFALRGETKTPSRGEANHALTGEGTTSTGGKAQVAFGEKSDSTLNEVDYGLQAKVIRNVQKGPGQPGTLPGTHPIKGEASMPMKSGDLSTNYPGKSPIKGGSVGVPSMGTQPSNSMFGQGEGVGHSPTNLGFAQGEGIDPSQIGRPGSN